MIESTLAYHITPTSDHYPTHKTGRIAPTVTAAQVTGVLGFPPNMADDESKVTSSWGFWVDRPDGSRVRCGVWDYKGARWSTFGPDDVLGELFGVVYLPGIW